ncbi:hypothetical protein OH77DRAFT_105526 [Trametes cingulata]|nr:hypothetical protein OH77DRAFT_105526 [Trametes cingulata]
MSVSSHNSVSLSLHPVRCTNPACSRKGVLAANARAGSQFWFCGRECEKAVIRGARQRSSGPAMGPTSDPVNVASRTCVAERSSRSTNSGPVPAGRSQVPSALGLTLTEEASRETRFSQERSRRRVHPSGILATPTSHSLLRPVEDGRTETAADSACVWRSNGLSPWRPGDVEAWWSNKALSAPVHPRPSPAGAESCGPYAAPAFRPGHFDAASCQHPRKDAQDVPGQKSRMRDVRETKETSATGPSGGLDYGHADRPPAELGDDAQVHADSSSSRVHRHRKMPLNPHLVYWPKLLKAREHLDERPGTPHPKDQGVRCDAYGVRIEPSRNYRLLSNDHALDRRG